MRYHWLTSLALAACACATAYEYEYVSGKLPFSESRFRAQVDAALDEAKKVLNVTRHPVLPNEVSHTYDDKYRLAELLTSLSDVAVLNVLGALGLSPEAREAARGWAAAGHAAVLRLNLTQQCELGDITSRKVESDVKRREKSAFGTKDSYIVTTKHEARYTLRRRFKLSLYPGPNADDARAIELDSQELVSTLVTSISENSEAAALHASPKRPFAAAVEMDLTSLVRRLTPSGALAFRIDRTTAITPRRNTEVAEAHDFAQRLYDAATGMKWRLDTVMDEDASVGHKLFVPVVPLFEARPEEAESATHNHTDSTRTASPPQSPPQSPSPQDDPHQSNVCEESRCSAPLLQPDDVGRLLSWHREGIRKAFAPSTPVQRLMLGLVNLREVAIAYVDGIGYIEETVREQLIAAVGKAVSARDLHSFMVHHYQRLYKSAYVPKPLTFAVRRPAHAPEGVLAIVDDKDQPVQMLGRQVVGHQPMTFALDSATQVTFSGERFLHVHMAHTFADEPPEDLWLHARARQFSSFAVLLGTCGGGQTFEPKHAFILQNKDELKIPLLLEQLPSHKAFRDAIASLSPEQQRFARAYRTLQLEDSVFGVLLIQLKPALEAVLNLPPDALTKEIALTQDLMKLFIEYQIPSDLLSYSGSDDASLGEKLAAVKEHARAITSMVDAEEREQIEQRERQREFASGRGRKMSGRGGSAGPEVQSYAASAFAAAASVHDEAMPRTPRSPPPPPPPPGSPPPGSPPPGSPRGVEVEAALPRAARSSSPSTPRAPPTPEPKQQQQQQQQAGETGNRGQRQGSAQETGSAADAAVGALDFSQVPSMLEAQYTKLDPLGAIRPTSIKVREPSDRACVRRGYLCLWTQSTQKGLLAEPQRRYFGSLDPITSGERQRAFDLLDALTRSGTLPLQEAALHVIVAATHSFADSVMATLVEKSVNPIEKLEASSLIIASVVHGAPPLQLLRDQEQQARIGQFADTSLLSA